jgi:hypothetical protein
MLTLRDALEAGLVDIPPLFAGPRGWNQWQAWRARAGLRPRLPPGAVVLSNGERALAAFCARESRQWQETMALYHGDDWRAGAAGALGSQGVGPLSAAEPLAAAAAAPGGPEAFSLTDRTAEGPGDAASAVGFDGFLGRAL